MIIKNKTINGFFIKRLNRFEAMVEIGGSQQLVHVPNSGRCREILTEGARVILEIRESKTRKTPYELIMVYKGDMLISIDSQAPNRIVEEAIRSKRIEGLEEYDYVKREVFYGGSRFDLFLKKAEDSGKEGSCYVEVKGVTLEEDGIAKFPDAPTERGARHLRELAAARKEGYRTVVVFLVQMENMSFFTPNRQMDPEFAKALEYAKANEVELLCYDCKVTETETILYKKLPVIL